MKDIITVGFPLPSIGEENNYRLNSFSSLSEADIVFFSPNFDETDYSNQHRDSFYSDKKYEGKPLYNQESTTHIREHSKHWKKELISFLNGGGTLFVMLCEKQEGYIYSGKRDVSGTGKNQKITHHVNHFCNYDFLPFLGIEYHASIGKTVYSKNNLYNQYVEQFKNLLSYKVYLSSDKIKEGILTTKNGDKILGAQLKHSKGHIIFLPHFNLYIKEYIDYNKETFVEQWNKEGTRKGKILIKWAVEVEKSLNSPTKKSPNPVWLQKETYSLKSSEITKKAIEKNDSEILKKTEQNKELRRVLEEQESLKGLLFETGKTLETSVIKALNILGYKAENYDDGQLELDQIIYAPEGHRYIGECEGKDRKAIDISKFRQLSDGLSADFEREEVEEMAFGLLFGNAQREVEPNKRELDFTTKCINGAKREGIGLIKTHELYSVCQYIANSNDSAFATKCRKAIHDQLGSIIKFPSFKE